MSNDATFRKVALATFTKGQRVELHPAMESWMRGDRYGEVWKIGTKYVHVKMDVSGRILTVLPENLQDANR